MMLPMPTPGTVIDLDDGNLYEAVKYSVNMNTHNVPCLSCVLPCGSRQCLSVCCSDTGKQIVFRTVPR